MKSLHPDPYPRTDPFAAPPIHPPATKERQPRRTRRTKPAPSFYAKIPGQATGRQVRGLSGFPDGRTRLGRLVREFKKELIEFVGGSPNAIEKALIDQCVTLRCKSLLMEQKQFQGEDTELDRAHYLAWQGALRRALASLTYREAAHTVRQTAEAKLLNAYSK